MSYQNSNLRAIQRRRKKFKDRGLCARCGKNKAIKGKTSCKKCLEINRKYTRECKKNKLKRETMKYFKKTSDNTKKQ